jgi:hypothetical protein
VSVKVQFRVRQRLLERHFIKRQPALSWLNRIAADDDAGVSGRIDEILCGD